MTEKRFPPSAQKLAKARREGRTVNSRWFSVGIGILVTGLVGQRTISLVRDRTLIHYGEAFDSQPFEMLTAAFCMTLESVLGVLIPVAVVGVGVHLLQTKGAFSLSRFATAASEIGPQRFATRIRESLREVPAALLRAALVLGVTFSVITSFIGGAAELAGIRWEYALGAIDSLLRAALFRVCSALMCVATVAYFVARRRFIKDLSMNMEELRQEVRDDCGDQHLKSARKAEAQALSLADLERRVKRSKVVVIQRKRD
jgi:flagellar biosynthesis protein FlhB